MGEEAPRERKHAPTRSLARTRTHTREHTHTHTRSRQRYVHRNLFEVFLFFRRFALVGERGVGVLVLPELKRRGGVLFCFVIVVVQIFSPFFFAAAGGESYFASALSGGRSGEGGGRSSLRTVPGRNFCRDEGGRKPPSRRDPCTVPAITRGLLWLSVRLSVRLMERDPASR